MIIREDFYNPKFNWSRNRWYADSEGLYSNGVTSATVWASFTYTFPTEGKISFNWATSTESSFDYLLFEIGSTQYIRYAGESGTQYYSRTMSPGTYTFYWGYQKDGSVNSRRDRVWIWNLQIEHGGSEVQSLSITPSVIHKEEVKLQASLVATKGTSVKDAQFRYRVLVDGKEAIPLSSVISPPYEIEHVLSADLFPIKKGVPVYLEVRDASSGIVYANKSSQNVDRVNPPPTVDMYLSVEEVHKENSILSVVIDDEHKDEVKYKLSLNGKQVLPESGWAPFAPTPHAFSYAARAVDLSIGENILKLDIEDDLGATTTSSIKLVKNNLLPSVDNGEVRGFTIYANLNDKDKDPVRYRIFLDGKQVFPETDWTKYLPVPVNVSYQITDPSVQAGLPHLVRIEVEDDLAGQTVWENNFVFDYPGLIFTDELGKYYSNHLGEILELLDTGVTVAGDDSAIYKIKVKNNSGFSVKNIRLVAVQRELDPINEVVQLSKTESPFEPSQELVFDEKLKHGSILEFYVRIHTTRKAIGGGQFDIYVIADPTN